MVYRLLAVRRNIQNINFKKNLKTLVLFGLAVTMGLSLAEPGASLALAEASKNNPVKFDYGKAKVLKSDDRVDDKKSTFSKAAVPAEAPKKVDRTKVREEESKRTANSSTYVNRDGTRTLQYSSTQQNYKKGAKWEKIDNKLSAVKPSKIDLSAAGLESTNNTAKTYAGKAGVIDTAMNSYSKGIVMNAEGQTIVMRPLGAKNVFPVQKDERTVLYKDVWPGIDVEYELRGESVKEIIIVKNKNATTNFNFAVDGGKVINHPTRKGELAIEGIDPNKFSFSSLTVDVYGQGIISEQRAVQKPTAEGINVTLDKAWLASLASSSFPIRVDPSFYRYNDIGNMYKSDGYVCNQSNCDFRTGMIANSGRWYGWRSMFHFDYNEAVNSRILQAQLDMPIRPNSNSAPETRELWASWAPCFGYGCTGNGRVDQGYADSSAGHINITSVLQEAASSGRGDAWFMLRSVEQGYKTYKAYYEMHINVVYDRPTPASTPISPANGQVVVDTQATLKSNTVTDPDGPVKYFFTVSTSPDAISGAVVTSDWIDTPQWNIPDDILQDGTTYYWKVQTKDMSYGVPTDGVPTSFKIDLRTGKDSTQSYDTVGPVGIDLATGNATLEASSHSMNALGGNIGVSLNYNTPNRAKKGIVGEYWNLPANYNFASGVPKDIFGNEQAPTRKVREQNVDLNWGLTSPAGVQNDWFYARYKGQFVAPQDGTYIFGGSNDDGMKIIVNGTKLYDQTCYTGICYDSTKSITLKAGQVVSINVEHIEATGNAYAKVYVKGAVNEQIVPRDWLYSDVMNQSISSGLMGRYYVDTGDRNIDEAAKDPYRMMLARQDTSMNLQFGLGGPAPGMRVDNFMARWTGYITVPTTGKYTLGAYSDDGIRIKTGTGLFGAMEELTSNSWGWVAGDFWGKEITLEAGKPTPIVIDYMEAGGPGSMRLKVKQGTGEATDMPASWLSPKASALPDNWQLGVDVDGNVGYERMRVSNNSATLYDSTGSTHEYTWTGTGYKPPVNEDGNLAKNADNTYTFIDTDGRTYIFDAEGKLISLTSPTDDRQPADLKYTYEGDPSRLVKISDSVDTSRYATLHYKGFKDDGMCGVPGGFDDAPAGMLCAIKTTDGDVTKFYYKYGQLARIEQPGQQMTDYSYDQFGRITKVRDSLAADVVAAGVRADDDSVTTQLSYDSLGRITNVIAPSANAGGKRLEHKFDYKPSITEMHITGAPEPNGFSKRIEYDQLLRTTKETDLTGKASRQEWDAVKDLQLSKTDATGLKSTTIYDMDDRATDSYGPAPSEWYGADRKPLAAKVNDIPHTSTGYDEGINGLQASYFKLS